MDLINTAAEACGSPTWADLAMVGVAAFAAISVAGLYITYRLLSRR